MHRLLYTAIVALLIMTGCQKDYHTATNANQISFATDTLNLDTILATNQPETSIICLYNRSSDDVEINSISLRGVSSGFTADIDGQGNSAYSVRLAGKDSLFIFVNYYPTNTPTPDLRTVTDYIDVISGTIRSTCVLTATEQSANVIKNDTITTSLTLTPAMPYAVYGTLTVAQNASISIEAGTHIYMQKDAQINVLGSIDTHGTAENPVLISGYLTGDFQKNFPAQWTGIYIGNGASCDMYQTHISGARYGIYADTAKVTLNNCLIRDCSVNAIKETMSDVSVKSSLLYDCGNQLIYANGGDLSVIHCTLSNYYPWQIRTTPAMQITNSESVSPLNGALIANSIVTGNLQNEFTADSCSTENLLAANSILKLNKKNSTAIKTDSCYVNIITEYKNLFRKIEDNDYHTDSTSTAYRAADVKYTELAPEDFEGNLRSCDTICPPNLGAY